MKRLAAKALLYIKNAKWVWVYVVVLVVLLPSVVLLANQQQQKNSYADTQVSIIDFGATPNDTTDDTAAIKNAIVVAKAQGKTVYVPAGKFMYTSFVLDGVQLLGEGDTSLFQAIDPLNATISLQGDKPSVKNMMIKIIATVRNGTNKHAFWVDHATNYEINHVTVDGAADSGIFSDGSSNGRITENVIKSTMADGIHTTNGAHDITIARNTVTNVGDDMISVVGYNDKGDCTVSAPYNILISYNNVSVQTAGRGISVVGGRDITITNNTVNRSAGAGFYFAAESGWKTCGDNNILVNNNTVDITNVTGLVDHPAVLVYADSPNQTIQNVLLEDNTISNTPNKPAFLIRSVSTNIALINNKISNTASGIGTSTTGNVY